MFLCVRRTYCLTTTSVMDQICLCGTVCDSNGHLCSEFVFFLFFLLLIHMWVVSTDRFSWVEVLLPTWRKNTHHFRDVLYGQSFIMVLKKLSLTQQNQLHTLITSSSLPFSVLSLWDWPLTWKTIILQCYYTVGWVIWPVKSSLKWPIMCRVGH